MKGGSGRVMVRINGWGEPCKGRQRIWRKDWGSARHGASLAQSSDKVVGMGKFGAEFR